MPENAAATVDTELKLAMQKREQTVLGPLDGTKGE